MIRWRRVKKHRRKKGPGVVRDIKSVRYYMADGTWVTGPVPGAEVRHTVEIIFVTKTEQEATEYRRKVLDLLGSTRR